MKFVDYLYEKRVDSGISDEPYFKVLKLLIQPIFVKFGFQRRNVKTFITQKIEDLRKGLQLMKTNFEQGIDQNESNSIFDLNSANKKYPKSYEIDHIINLLRLIKDTMILLDPTD